ncbi:TRAP transporter substrate-binding protein [Methylobacterium sp. WSM2598]|uniref:TRAP transporter substrate-binding protein n=1 Tax=Methylobacterium sp. WSM2598 TaxID=398261 RepID=UPI0003619A53|nr:TRAP transporter substrate-binding protein [Methylobacterium sp. WSM2598]
MSVSAGRRGWLGRVRARGVGASLMLLAATGAGAAQTPLALRVVGGLAGVRQFTQFEEPFWSREIAERSGGRVVASIHAFDRSGLRGEDMLQLMRLGVVPFGTVLLSLAAGEDPELTAVDLPGLNPDTRALRRSLAAFRPHMRRVLDERYGIELLGVYAYPAQVLYCAEAFRGLDDLAGRRVRISSVNQSEFVRALGGVPIIVPFSETTGAVARGVADCAITGTLSGLEIGLTAVTSHVHALPINWGLSIFGANRDAWGAIAPDLREAIRRGVGDLEERIWRMAEADTARGLACSTGAAECPPGSRAGLTLVPVSAEDEERRLRLLQRRVPPDWIERCGRDCGAAWNAALAATTGIRADER